MTDDCAYKIKGDNLPNQVFLNSREWKLLDGNIKLTFNQVYDFIQRLLNLCTIFKKILFIKSHNRFNKTKQLSQLYIRKRYVTPDKDYDPQDLAILWLYCQVLK